ncbi:hypothetical protein M514_00023, partial [Trichuris suis]
MIHGRKFTLLTDHKPLVAVFGSKKGVPMYTANRLERWATTLLGYDFTIEYHSTENFGQADALSRLVDKHTAAEEDVVIAAINAEHDVRRCLSDSIHAFPVTSELISRATAEDSILTEVMKCIMDNWAKPPVSKQLQPFFNRRNALSVVEGCIMMTDRVVIPKRLQPAILKQLHQGHPGIVQMKAIARSYIYWPGLDNEIETVVRSCDKCSAVAKTPVKTELSSWPIPEKPWSRIHVDYAGPMEGQYFLVVVDAYSKWPEIFMMNHITTAATLENSRKLFTQFGLPEVLVSDNGAQFTSAEFTESCMKNGIQHIRAPPYHPQSSGQAERFVDTFKRSLVKMKGEQGVKGTLQTFLFHYRSTPCSAIGKKSPAELFLGRRLRLTLDLIRPTVRQQRRRNEKMEQQFNRRHGARKREFSIGDTVLVKDHYANRWIPATVRRRLGNVVYQLETKHGMWYRHANQIQQRKSSNKLDVKGTPSLLNTFGLDDPTLHAHVEVGNSLEDQEQPEYTQQQDPHPEIRLRRSSRIRQKPLRLDVDPKQKTYRFY